jgi:hypothetical protein
MNSKIRKNLKFSPNTVIKPSTIVTKERIEYHSISPNHEKMMEKVKIALERYYYYNISILFIYSFNLYGSLLFIN